MTELLRPRRGGFLRPFGCGWFIREFLLGNGPNGSPTIDRDVGAPQVDIFYYYKLAPHRAYAEDAVGWENEGRVREGKPIYTPEEYEDRVATIMRRIPYKLTKCRYHSFQRYFHWLKQLEWVEFTGKEEPSSIQDNYPDAPPRKYYRLTRKGMEAAGYEWSNPQLALYPERSLQYFRQNRQKRKGCLYSPKRPRRKTRV